MIVDSLTELQQLVANCLPDLPADIGGLRGRAAAEFLLPRFENLTEEYSRKSVVLALAGRVNELQDARFIAAMPLCPRCNVTPELGRFCGYTLTCPGCFDQADDSVSGLGVSGESLTEAGRAWREKVAEYIEDNAP